MSETIKFFGFDDVMEAHAPTGSYDYFFQKVINNGAALRAAQEEIDGYTVAKIPAEPENPMSSRVYIPFESNVESLALRHADKMATVCAALYYPDDGIRP